MVVSESSRRYVMAAVAACGVEFLQKLIKKKTKKLVNWHVFF